MNDSQRQQALGYLPEIDGLRALSIIGVVGYHFFPGAVRGGFTGVDVFFVISGYLIFRKIAEDVARGTFTLTDFYARRSRRIFPALAFVLLLTYAIGYIVLSESSLSSLSRSVLSSAAFIQNLNLIAESGYFDDVAIAKPLLHVWSLSVEEQFYLLIPLVFPALRSQSRRLLVAGASVVVASFLWAFVASGSHPTASYYSVFTRAWELLSGALLGHLHATRIARPRDPGYTSSFFAATGILLVIGSFAFIDKSMRYPGPATLVPVIGTLAILAAGSRAGCTVRALLDNGAAVRLGLISYPLYLVHWPVLSYASLLTGNQLQTGAKILLILGSVVLAQTIYQLLELKIARITSLRMTAVGSSLSLLFIGLLAFQGMRQGEAPPGRGATSWRDFAREGSCFISNRTKTPVHAPECYEAGSPSIVLWGDSNAAAVYPGVREFARAEAAGLTQLTHAGCPPILGLVGINPTDPEQRDFCNKNNERIFQFIAETRPALVVLSAGWSAPSYEDIRTEFATSLPKTIQKIQIATPASRIVVIGPPGLMESRLSGQESPAMEDSLESGGLIYLRAYRSDDLDRALRASVFEAGATYFSVYMATCIDAYCRRVVDTDGAHFSKEGAELVIRIASPDMQALLPAAR